MKFLCDRCKTRYSIGDDRVRGKILKIRCKNCANVITVREGMAEVEPADGVVAAGRRTKSTTVKPAVAGGPAKASALGAAFATQMTKPPPALEEEWYVSVDGDQAGPFTLGDAQRWVAAKPWDADLHCWSEGFDDWLAVDKVSHFRGLRKKPHSAPPLPRAGAPRRPIEDEPKPLFAATMASLEKAGAAADRILPITAASTPIPGVKANGSAISAPPRTEGSGGARSAAAAPAAAVAKPASGPNAAARFAPMPVPARVSTVPGLGGATPTSQGAKALAAAFDIRDPADSVTAIEAPPFVDEVVTNPEPVAAKRASAVADAAVTFTAAPRTAQPAPASGPSAVPLYEDDDELAIGEVSRVVKLADLLAPPQRKVSRPPLARTAAVPKLGAGEVGPLASAPPGAPAMAGLAPSGELAPGESVVLAPVVARARRSGMIMLIGVTVVLLGVVGGVVLLLTSSDSDELPMGLGRISQIDTSRPEDIAHPKNPNDPGSGSAPAPKPVRHWIPGNQHVITPTEHDTPDPTGSTLKAEEIEDMATKQAAGTQRCYMRAQRGALGVEIADLKKVSVTLAVDKEGTVTDVQLSEHGGDQFGQCLVGRVRSWKFRPSVGGTFRIALVFSSD